MDIYLVRHGDAVVLGEQGITNDEDRPLTAEGKVQARAAGTQFVKRGLRLDRILTSPLVRARQTGEGMLQAWAAPAPAMEECELLVPGSGRKELARHLRDLGGDQVALVGHQPDLGLFLTWLIGCKKAQVNLSKGGVAYVNCPEGARKGGGTLLWLVTPKWLKE